MMKRFRSRGSSPRLKGRGAVVELCRTLLSPIAQVPLGNSLGVAGALGAALALVALPAPVAEGAEGVADEALVEQIQSLLRAPMDDPRHIEFVVNTPPLDAVQAAAEAGRQLNNRVAPLHVYLHGLAGMIEANPGDFEEELEKRLAATDSQFFPPDLIAALDQIVAELDAERVGLLRRASIYERTGGIPLPRKRNMNAQTGELTKYSHDRLAEERRTLVANEEQLTELRGRYPVLMAEMGLYYEKRYNLTMAFDCFSRSLGMDYDAWQRGGKRYDEAYLKAASFMILSAHRSDEVLALYHLTPMDPEPLERLVVSQIDQRARIYAKAADQYTNHASVNQALRDLLYTLIEDEGAIEFLPESERRNFLDMIGKTTLAKRHYQEAIGVYATLGDKKKLIELGEKLSKNVYSTRRGQAYINRDMAWAIDAFREAQADDEMAELLQRVTEAKEDLDRGKLKVDEPQILITFWNKLNDYVNGSGEAEESILANMTGARPDRDATPTPMSGQAQVVEASAEELPVMIKDYASQVRKAVPGQDVSYTQSQLLILGEQAERTKRLALALEAYAGSGPEGAEKAGVLIEDLLKKGRYSDLARLLPDMGSLGDPYMAAMAKQILDRGIAPRGVYNPDIRYAVIALIELDDVDRVEDILNELLQLKVQFAQLQNQAEVSGRAVANRNLSQLEDTLDLIKEAYEIVGLPERTTPKAPPPEEALKESAPATSTEG